MLISDVQLNDKHRAIFKDSTRFQFFEGVTGSSKSLIAGMVFFLRVFNSPENVTQFVTAGSSMSTIERMIIDAPAGFYNLFRGVCEYKKAGIGGSRIEVQTPTGVKKIYMVGYDNKTRYRAILGLTLGGFLIEEIHTTNDEFIREMFTRLYRDSGFLYCTGNAGLPDQIVYTDYLNKGRPHPKFVDDVPAETMKELEQVDPDHNFRYWWFGFRDNPTFTTQEINDLYGSHPIGSFEYNSKILAIRGYTTGLLYARLLADTWLSPNTPIGQNIKMKDLKLSMIKRLHIGIDIGDNAKTVFTLTGTTHGFERVIVIDSIETVGDDIDYNEIINQFNTWLLPYYSMFNTRIKSIRPDSADSLFVKTLRNNVFTKAIDVISSNKATIKERVTMKEQLLHRNRMIFTDKPGAQTMKVMLSKIRTDGKGGHLDESDPWIDYSDSLDYSITPDMHGIMAQ